MGDGFEYMGMLQGSAGTIIVMIVLRLLVKFFDLIKLPVIANQIRHLIGDNQKDIEGKSNALAPTRSI